MKAKLFLFLTCFFFLSQVHAQQVMVEVGNTKSTFKYTDSKGQPLENVHSEDQFNYAIGYRMTLSKMFLPERSDPMESLFSIRQRSGL